ncbi:MAG: hypothetical protein M3439_04025, partial [Chloroflexota bacterium]|nr:hypothetical protein [Chloroflexota bacterium]
VPAGARSRASSATRTIIRTGNYWRSSVSRIVGLRGFLHAFSSVQFAEHIVGVCASLDMA